MEKEILCVLSTPDFMKRIIPMAFDQDARLCETHNVPLKGTGGKRNLFYCVQCCEESRRRYEHSQQKEQLYDKQKIFEEMLAASCIPRRFMGSSLENFIATTDEQEKILEGARQLAEGQNFTGAVFVGVPGTGNTLPQPRRIK